MAYEPEAHQAHPSWVHTAALETRPSLWLQASHTGNEVAAQLAAKPGQAGPAYPAAGDATMPSWKKLKVATQQAGVTW